MNIFVYVDDQREDRNYTYIIWLLLLCKEKVSAQLISFPQSSAHSDKEVLPSIGSS